MKDDRQCVKFVEAWSYVPIFDIGKATQMNYEIWAPALTSQFIACPFNVAIGQTKTFASVSKTGTRVDFCPWELTRWAYVSESHSMITFLLRIQNGTVFASEGIPM